MKENFLNDFKLETLVSNRENRFVNFFTFYFITLLLLLLSRKKRQESDVTFSNDKRGCNFLFPFFFRTTLVYPVLHNENYSRIYRYRSLLPGQMTKTNQKPK